MAVLVNLVATDPVASVARIAADAFGFFDFQPRL
jgi:hypothetical protein